MLLNFDLYYLSKKICPVESALRLWMPITQSVLEQSYLQCQRLAIRI